MHLKSILTLAGVLAHLSQAQRCPPGKHVSGPLCCRDGWEYTTGVSGKGTCCPPEYKYDEASGKCTKTTTSSWSSSFSWKSVAGKWFVINGKHVQITEGGFFVNGQFNEMTGVSVTIAGEIVTIRDGSIVVGGRPVQLTGQPPSMGGSSQSVDSIDGDGDDFIVDNDDQIVVDKPKDCHSVTGEGVPPTSPPKATDDNPSPPSSGIEEPKNPGLGPFGEMPAKPGSPPGPSGGMKISTTLDGSCGCGRNQPCFDAENLGIQYGKCYNLIDVNGLPLNRDTGGVYQSGGDVGNLIFRVCKNTDSCDLDVGQPISQNDGKFNLQDQLGWKDWKGPAWWGNNWPHFAVDRKSKAVTFTAEALCTYGAPAICLRDGEKGLGMAAPCPLGGNAAMSHIYYTNNRNPCKAYRFIETKCLKDVGVEKN